MLWLINLVRVYVTPNMDHSAGAGRPGPCHYNIVVLIYLHDVPVVKWILKPLLRLLPHDVVTYGSEPQIPGVTGWSIHWNCGRGLKYVIILKRSRTVGYRFIISVDVWYVWCECYANVPYISSKITPCCRWILTWINFVTIRYKKYQFYACADRWLLYMNRVCGWNFQRRADQVLYAIFGSVME